MKFLFKTEESLYKYSTANTIVQYLLYPNSVSALIHTVYHFITARQTLWPVSYTHLTTLNVDNQSAIKLIKQPSEYSKMRYFYNDAVLYLSLIHI